MGDTNSNFTGPNSEVCVGHLGATSHVCVGAILSSNKIKVFERHLTITGPGPRPQYSRNAVETQSQRSKIQSKSLLLDIFP